MLLPRPKRARSGNCAPRRVWNAAASTPYGSVTADGDVDQSPRGPGGGLDTSQEVPKGRTAKGVAVSQAIQWSSEYHDPELDLIYYKTADGCKAGWMCAKHAPRRGETTSECRRINYRYYNPTDGRWMRRDPIGNGKRSKFIQFLL